MNETEKSIDTVHSKVGLTESSNDFVNAEEKSVDIDEALEQVGCGWHQYLVVISTLTLRMMPGMTVYPIAFYELMPQYECKVGDIWTNCVQKDFCVEKKLDPTVDFRVKNSLYSIDNWVNQYGLTCSSRQTIGSIGTVYFLGMILGSLVVPKLSDVYGRKPIVLVATAVQIFVLCANLIGTNIN